MHEIENMKRISIATQTIGTVQTQIGIQVSPEVATKRILVNNVTKNNSKDSSTDTTFDNEAVINERSTLSLEDRRIEMHKPRLLIVSECHGKNIGKILHYQSHYFRISSFVKPYASDSTLIKALLVNSVGFTKKDFVIL